MGGYIRLSKEDLQKINRGLDDSNSVKNQRDILNDFHSNHAEEFESYTEYADDGHTGTDTERESFRRLLGDVMNGKITCVVMKDLSRFARNYSDAGSLIDNIFVQMGVRFISLAESVDSYLNPDSVNSIIVSITNVMNDQYCYQTSKKIRQVFDYKRRNGQYIGSFAPTATSKTRQTSINCWSIPRPPKPSSACIPCSCKARLKGPLRCISTNMAYSAPRPTAGKRACPFPRLWRTTPCGGPHDT